MRTDSAALKKTALQSFLEEYRTARGSKTYNFTSAASPTGAYYVPEERMAEFTRLYIDVIEKDGVIPHLTEKQGKFSPILIDLDFKFPLEAGHERRWDGSFVKKIVAAYVGFLSKYLVLDEIKSRCYVLERPGPYVTDTCVKDGIHMIFPNITCGADIKTLVREHVMRECSEIFNNLQTENSISDIVDSAVLRNNWYLYGSGKPGVRPYELTRIIDRDIQECEIDSDDTHSLKKLIPLLRVCGTTAANVKFQDDMEDQLLEDFARYEARTDPNPARRTEIGVDTTNGRTHSMTDSAANYHVRERTGSLVNKSKFDYCENLVFVKDLVQILSPDRAEDYKSWIGVGWALHNIDKCLLDDWVEWSRQSSKFEDGACERLWASMRDTGLGLGSLVRWAMQDDANAYNNLRSQDINTLMEAAISSNGAHHSIAKVLYGMYRYHFVCLSRKFRSWIEFRDHHWHRTEDGYGLLTRLSSDLYHEFTMLNARYSSRIAGSQDDDKDMLEKRRNVAGKIATRLLDNSYKMAVMKEAHELFYVQDFEEKLDTNCQLIGFENGTYDFDKLEFRDGRPEDCITLSTGNDYVEWDEENSSDAIKKVLLLLSRIHVDEAVREYILVLLSSFLSGQVKSQKMILWTGSGANGKSFLVDLVNNAMGDYAGGLPISLLTQKRSASNAASPELSRTKGKRFCVLQEPEDDVRINVGLMKELSGGDRIVTRDLFSPVTEFKPQFKMVLTCNRLPEIPSNDGGTWRRIRVVEFKSKFCEFPNPRNPLEFVVDEDLQDSVRELGQALMSVLIKKYKKFKEFGIREPESVLQYTQEYQRQCDVYLDYVNKMMVATDDKHDTLRLSEIYSNFKEFWRTYMSDMSKFPASKDLKSYIDQKVQQSKNNVWRGYKLRAIGEEEVSEAEEE